MSKRIPQAFIDEIISRADIVDVVGRRVALKRAGANFKGLCPFHDEKTPSFIVTPARGTYHCFGCAVHGTAIRFLMEYENMSFPEAVEALAEALGLSMPDNTVEEPNSEIDALFGLLGEADQIYRTELRNNQGAIDYLQGRGIEGATAARFGIGYAPDAWDTLMNRLGGSESRINQLLQAGLIVQNDSGRRYDRFRDRIMFPIRDTRGRVIGFGGRVMGSGEPKYLNSPETPIFHKGQALYGLYEARQIKGRPEHALVVEGYVDVATLAQHGIGPALATLGTATTADHIRRLTRIADRVIFCFDGDAAGRKAAWRALETALAFGGGQIELKFLLLPEGEDPDSLVQSGGSAAFNGLMENSLPLSQFFIDELRRQNDVSSADGRARLIAMAKPLLGKLPEGVYRALLITELAATIGLDRTQIETVLESAGSATGTAVRHAPSEAKRDVKPTLIRKAISLVLHYPSVAGKIGEVDGFAAIDLPGATLLRSLIKAACAGPTITTAHLIEQFRDDAEGRYLPRIAGDLPLDDEEGAAAVLESCLQRMVADERRRKTVAAIKGRGRQEPG